MKRIATWFLFIALVGTASPAFGKSFRQIQADKAHLASLFVGFTAPTFSKTGYVRTYSQHTLDRLRKAYNDALQTAMASDECKSKGDQVLACAQAKAKPFEPPMTAVKASSSSLKSSSSSSAASLNPVVPAN